MNPRKIIEDLLAAMKASQDNWCTDHLDCWPESKQVWYDAIDRAFEFLRKDLRDKK